jgi:hypothetical protein
MQGRYKYRNEAFTGGWMNGQIYTNAPTSAHHRLDTIENARKIFSVMYGGEFNQV